MAVDKKYPPITPSNYRVSLPAGEEFEFVSAHTIFPYKISGPVSSYTNEFTQTVYANGEKIFENAFTIFAVSVTGDTYRGQDVGYKLKLKNGTIYKIVYTYHWQRDYNNQFTNTVSYTMSAVENKRPLKQWTITDVINRLLDVAEPIRKGEKPRFKLNPEQAVQFDKILAPQLSFTKQTLRECLQEVGRVIHGEPRLKPKKYYEPTYEFIASEKFKDGKVYLGSNRHDPYLDGEQYCILIGNKEYALRLESEAEDADDQYYFYITDLPEYSGEQPVYLKANNADGKYYLEVSYDMYASQEKSGIYTLPFLKENVSQLMDSYQSWLDSNAENLVNQLDKFSGVIVEPYRDGAKTVRTESLFARIEEGNMIIPTQYPIYSVDKLEYVYTADGVLKSVDITPYLFEKSVYDSQLSSYQGQYPYSKAYGLFYTQGGKNIGGLNFRLDRAVAAVFEDYAIANIIRQATGNSKLFSFKPFSDEAKLQYPQMAFRVTYTPFYNARVAQTKSYYKDFIRPAALIYNQASNVIESRYYGEHLKGAVARLGNVDKSLTYLMYNINLIPRAGQMFDKDYYISAVAVSILPTCIICTIALSKDFNRISGYIGINSEKRYSEISQNQAVERNTLYREYVVIGDREKPDTDCLIGNNMLAMIADTFTQNGGYMPLSNVCAWGTSYNGNDIGSAIDLPVISSAFGNSISFSWQYEDNYSAGATAQYQSNNEIFGYFQNSQSYTDYYGRIYYYNFDLQAKGPAVTAENLTELGLNLPRGEKPVRSSGYVSTVGQTPYILRKDNREALQVNFQIDFVTNREDLIIGSALASYCPAVRGSGNVNDEARPLTARLYVFDTELNKFTDHVEAYEQVDLSKMQSAEVTVDLNNGYFAVNAGAFPTTETGKSNGKSWAIITAQYSKTETVEGEDGKETPQTTFYGGDLLIGQNIEVTAGQAFAPIYFTKKREIFDRTVWKDRW